MLAAGSPGNSNGKGLANAGSAEGGTVDVGERTSSNIRSIWENGMYLKTLRIRGFRGLTEASVEWHKGVNVLVGENNSGKTAIIDALRLSLSLGDGQRDIWIRREDYHVFPNGEMAESIQFDLTWGDLTDEEKGVFIDMLAIPENGEVELQLHVRFDYDHERDRPKRPVYWGGEKEGQAISADVLDIIEHIHLGALRDATRDLAPGRGNQLSRLFLKLASKPEGRDKLAKEISDRIRGVALWGSFPQSRRETHQRASSGSFA